MLADELTKYCAAIIARHCPSPGAGEVAGWNEAIEAAANVADDISWFKAQVFNGPSLETAASIATRIRALSPSAALSNKIERPEWPAIYDGVAKTLNGDENDLHLVTQETLRLAVNALRKQNAEDYYHNYGAAEQEILQILRVLALTTNPKPDSGGKV